MSKLQELLASKAKLESEIEGLKNFLNVVHSHAPLTVSAGGESLQFEDADLGVELKILAVMREDFEVRVNKLDSVSRKVAALEELIG
ncbi:coil containing protein [Vibrio phage 1.097.O._10N.286.49.B3]|uniref:Coil containing protein n=1 Tax=Vibrio phage 1.097.O._10N.286.49.B3 TaxID=1881383 RepID=A0A2I7R0N0_9CAUD|nr:coil containing protein [Vibrio phage 1.097.O._10N.286.49.B3]AUR87206.1 coil containing protein [Vibrio phage 1.097.O._10N.286.49.B3]